MTATTAPRISEFVDEGFGHSSYLVNLDDGTALVIDPARIPDAQMEEAARRGLSITFTADTHTHADYVSGSTDLASRGALFVAPTDSKLQVPHHGMLGGDELAVGRYRLRAIATPGHTPDHLAYVLLDANAPVALFSGGSLMVGTAGRTDLLGMEHADELAHRLYHSLHDELLTLPDELPVYPTHGAGSFCAAPKTVYNYFPTKEDLVVDLEEPLRERLVELIQARPSGVSPATAIRPEAIAFVESIRDLSPEQVRGGLGHLGTLSPTIRRVSLEMTDRLGSALGDAICNSTDLDRSQAHLEGISLAWVFQLITDETGQRSRDGRNPAQIADAIAPIIEGLFDWLEFKAVPLGR